MTADAAVGSNFYETYLKEMQENVCLVERKPIMICISTIFIKTAPNNVINLQIITLPL